MVAMFLLQKTCRLLDRYLTSRVICDAIFHHCPQPTTVIVLILCKILSDRRVESRPRDFHPICNAKQAVSDGTLLGVSRHNQSASQDMAIFMLSSVSG
jgi:hypothetical protein